jgi:hypothetical protein
MYTKYLKVKKQIAYNYKGYALEKIIAKDLIFFIFGKIVYFPLKRIFKNFRNAFPCNFIKNVDFNNKILYTSQVIRSDYLEIINFVNSNISNIEYIDLSLSKKHIKFYKIRNILSSILIVLLKVRILYFKEKLVLVSIMCYYKNTIDIYENSIKTINISKYIAFNGSIGIETFLTLFFKKRNIVTYSLQHGIYHEYIPPIPYDALNYENFCADYLLCWGQYTIDEFENSIINREKLLLAGFPRKTIELSSTKIRFDKGLILLGGKKYTNMNFAIIDIAAQMNKEKNIQFKIKLHPGLKLEDYKNICEEYKFEVYPKEVSISQIFKKKQVGFSICINTTAYYESYMFGIPAFRYKKADCYFDLFQSIYNDIFESKEELYGLFSDIKAKNNEQYWDTIQEKLKYSVGFGLNNYSILLSE